MRLIAVPLQRISFLFSQRVDYALIWCNYLLRVFDKTVNKYFISVCESEIIEDYRLFANIKHLPAVKSSDEFAKEKTLPVKKREGSL